MTISYPLSMPTSVGPRRIAFNGINAVSMSRSPMSFATQVQEFQGQMWTCEIQLPPLTREQADEWVAFLAALHGPRGTFYVSDPAAIVPRGTATGTPRVKGAGQTGNVLVTDGWTPSTSNILRAGDKFQLGNRLYLVLKDASTNGSGETTLDIWPRLLVASVDDESIVTIAPKGLFRLSDQNTPLWSTDETIAYDLGFSAVEAV